MSEILIAMASILLVAISQLLFKSAMSTSGGLSGVRGVRKRLHPKIAIGLTLNLASALCWIIALRKLEISFLYPMPSINYLLVPIGAWWCFGERITTWRRIAICVIWLGVFICLLGGHDFG